LKISKINIFLYISITYLLIYDYFFLHVEDILDRKLYAFKMLYEYVLLFLITIYFIYITKFKKAHKNVIYISIFSIIFLVLGFTKNHDIVSSVKDFRLFFLPILLSLFLYYSLWMKNVNIKQLTYFYIIVSTLILFIGIYEYFTFNGDIKSIWRYKYLLEVNKELNPNFLEHFIGYQLMRNSEIRVSSIFISSLDFSYYISFFAFFIYLYFIKNKKVIYLLSLILILFGIYIAQVRTGFILLFLSIFIYHLLNSNKKYYNYFAISSPFLLIIFTFLYMFIGGALNDSSTLGRLLQYVTLVKAFSLLGSGLGKYAFSFDSLYIYILLTYGLFSIILIIFQFKIIKTLLYLFHNRKAHSKNVHEVVFIEFMSVYSLSILYLFAFQHTLGSPTFFLLYLFSFIIIYKLKHNTKVYNNE